MYMQFVFRDRGKGSTGCDNECASGYVRWRYSSNEKEMKGQVGGQWMFESGE